MAKEETKDTKETKKAKATSKSENTEKKENTAAGHKAENKKETEPSQEELLNKQLSEKSDQLLRTLAKYDNFRKRSAKEKEQAYSDSAAAVLTKFLPILDNFERAALNDNAEKEDYKKGVEMIFAQFSKVISDSGITPFGEKGDKFDPLLHSAVMHIEDETLGENEVAEVFAKGYKLGDRILRPATVKVAN